MEAPNQQQNWLQEFNHMVLIYSCRPGDQELHSVCLSPWLASVMKGNKLRTIIACPKTYQRALIRFWN